MTEAVLVELLDTVPRTPSDVWGATIHFAQQGIVDEVGYWLGHYRIKRDTMWADLVLEDGTKFQEQDEWLYYLDRLPRSSGGCKRATWFEKMGLIESLVSRGIPDNLIVSGLIHPTATKLLLAHEDELPVGKSVSSMLDETKEMGASDSASLVSEVIGLKKQWVHSLSFSTQREVLKFIVCEEDENGVDQRTYLMDIPHEDALVLAKAMRKTLELI
jgi:hypothetical protein